jgi:hypothetical protein
MQISPEAAVQAFLRLQDQTPAVQLAAEVSVLKKTMEMAETTMAILLQGLDPNKGQRIDQRA